MEAMTDIEDAQELSEFDVQTSEGWPRSWTRLVGRELARRRREAGLSQTGLCEKCAAMGYPVARNTVVGLETGRREGINVHEVAVIAAALDVEPTALLFPANQFVEYLPGEQATNYEALERFTGEKPSETTPGQVLDRLVPADDLRNLVNLVNLLRRCRHDK